MAQLRPILFVGTPKFSLSKHLAKQGEVVTDQCGKHILAPKIQSDILTKETKRYVVPPAIPNPKKKLVQAGFSGYFLR